MASGYGIETAEQELARVNRYLTASPEEQARLRDECAAKREHDLGHVSHLRTIQFDPTDSAEAFGLFPGDSGYSTFEADFPKDGRVVAQGDLPSLAGTEPVH